MTLLHKECLGTELALPANQAIIAASAVSEVATGSGVPSGAPATGVKLYVDTATKNIYYWDGAAWGQSSAGALVAAGVPSGAPTSGNTLYVDSSTGTVYYWNGAVWTAVASGGSSTTEVAAAAGVPSGAPAAGVTLYVNTSAATLYYWNGSVWTLLSPPSEPLFSFFNYK